MSRAKEIPINHLVINAIYHNDAGEAINERLTGFNPTTWWQCWGEQMVTRFTATNGAIVDYEFATSAWNAVNIPPGTTFVINGDHYRVQIPEGDDVFARSHRLDAPAAAGSAPAESLEDDDARAPFEPRPVHGSVSSDAEHVRMDAAASGLELDMRGLPLGSIVQAATLTSMSAGDRPFSADGAADGSRVGCASSEGELLSQLITNRIAPITTNYWYEGGVYPNPTGLFETLDQAMWAIALYARNFHVPLGLSFAMRVAEQRLLTSIEVLTTEEESTFFDRLIEIAKLQIDDATKGLCAADGTPILEEVEMKDGTMVTKPKTVSISGGARLEKEGDLYVWGGDDLTKLADAIYKFARANQMVIRETATHELSIANVESVVVESIFVINEAGAGGGGDGGGSGSGECKEGETKDSLEEVEAKTTQSAPKSATIMDNFKEREVGFELKLPSVKVMDLDYEDNGVKQYREAEAKVEADLAQNFAEIRVSDCATEDLDGDFSAESMVYRPELSSAQFLAGAMLIGSMMLNHDGDAGHALGVA